jgi:hypothetical protein
LAETTGWLDERVEDWSKRGFDGPKMAAHLVGKSGNISEAVLHLEKKIERSEWLIKEVKKFPLAWPERSEILDSLCDPSTIELNERRWRELIHSRRPWHAIAEKFGFRWTREGRSQELGNWLDRLDRVDPSMIPQAGELLAALESAAFREEMEAIVSSLEGRQNRRVQALEETVFHLRDGRGWTLSALSGNLQERYAEVGRIQDLDSILMTIEEYADDVISMYDRGAAAELLQRAELAQKMEDEGRLTELLEQAELIASDFENRLIKIDEWLKDLDGRQLHLNAPRPPTPADLLILEAGVDGFEAAITRLNAAWLRLDGLLDLFPEESGGAAALQGQVDMVTIVEELVNTLQARRDENDSRARGRLQSWAKSGFEVEPFEVLLDQRPRVGWLAVEEHAERVKVCKQILSNIDLLDISYAGAEESAEWSDKLHAAGVDSDDVSSVKESLQKRMKRNGRHRAQLDKVRIGLSGSWPSGLSATSLSLSEYEAAVTALQVGEEIPGHIEQRLSSARKVRLLATARAELDLWRTGGWDITGLDKMYERTPTELWASITQIRNTMDDFDHLRERLSRLPLARSVELLDRVDTELRRPEMLQGLADSLPSLAAELAAFPENANENEFKLFEPTILKPVAKLHSVVPTLMPLKPKPEVVLELTKPAPEISVEPTRLEKPDGDSDYVESARSKWMDKMSGVDYKTADIDEDKLQTEQRGGAFFDFPGSTDVDDSVSSGPPDGGRLVWAGEPEKPPSRAFETVDILKSVKRPTLFVKDDDSASETEIGDELRELIPLPDKKEFEGDELEKLKSEREVTVNLDELNWDSVMLKIGGKVDLQPRDIRVQRLARLMMLLEPLESDSNSQLKIKGELIYRLEKTADGLEKWTKLRLANRNSATDGSLLKISARLASRLDDIPGPGIELPVKIDEENLPDNNDLKGIEVSVLSLETSTKIPYAGGKPELAVVS